MNSDDLCLHIARDAVQYYPVPEKCRCRERMQTCGRGVVGDMLANPLPLAKSEA